MAAEPEGPTVLRLMLGIRLRQLREARGLTPNQAATAIRGTDSKISRIELGRNPVREIDVEDLLTLYGVIGTAEREEILTLAARAGERGWWHRYGDIVPGWLQTYLGMEQAAESIRTFEPQFVPGLLQTESYAAALVELGGFPPGEAGRRIQLRAERQRRFRDGKLTMWAIIDESVLRRQVGDPAVLREQLEYLLEASGRPNLTLQVLPFATPAYAAPGGFSVVRFESPELPDMVYAEHLTSAVYIDKQSEVDTYVLAIERLAVVSAQPRHSAEIIEDLLKGSSTR